MTILAKEEALSGELQIRRHLPAEPSASLEMISFITSRVPPPIR
jgi:hypothetical protein